MALGMREVDYQMERELLKTEEYRNAVLGVSKGIRRMERGLGRCWGSTEGKRRSPGQVMSSSNFLHSFAHFYHAVLPYHWKRI